jgi:DNA-directed RNA polymerase specialized sigma24 family protein
LLVRMVRSGLNKGRISRILGRSRTAVHNRLHRLRRVAESDMRLRQRGRSVSWLFQNGGMA